MDWKYWKPKYREIVEKLNIDPKSDRHAAHVLEELISEADPTVLEEKIRRKDCIVFGAGPSLMNDLERLKEAGWLKKNLITADGATSAVLDFKIPDIIVTDLDGGVEDQLEAWEEGAWMVVHAHGDNIEKVKKIVPRLKERVLGSIQVDETEKIMNFGGFTDGDRAAFLANHFGASTIYLSGMDLGTDIGRWTGKTDYDRKVKKLEICKDLLSWLSTRFNANLVNITSEGIGIPNVPQGEIPTGQQVK